VRLLDRNRRGIEPTIYAAALLKREHAVFDELRQGIKEIEYLSNPTSGEVRIAAPEILACGFVPDVISRIALRYPQIRIHVVSADTSTLEFRELRERKVDLLLARVPDTAIDDDINLDTFLDDPHFVVAGTKNPCVRRRKLSLADLVNEPWVIPRGQVVRGIIASAFRAHGLPFPQERVTSGTLYIQQHLLATGRFLTITAKSFLHYNAQQWSLVALPINLRIKFRPHAIVTLKNRTLSPVVQVFIDELKAVANSMKKRLRES
jgi:DNA-binding transcriptional LysR family regulator